MIQIISILLPVFVCASIGLLWARFNRPFDTDTIGQLVMNVGAPCLIISTFSQTQLDLQSFFEMAGYTLLVIAVTMGLGILFIRAWSLDVRAFLPSVVFVNTGNLGLPICLFAFGDQGLAYGIAFFMVMSVLHFSLGLAMVSGKSVLKTLVTNPIVHSVWIAVALLTTQWTLPDWLINTLSLLGGFAIPLMLIALGVSLASLKVSDFSIACKMSILRILGGTLIGLAITEMFNLTGALKGVIIIQSAMPVAVFNYLLAVRYNRFPQQIAGAVVTSSIVSFLSLPFLLWLVL